MKSVPGSPTLMYQLLHSNSHDLLALQEQIKAKCDEVTLLAYLPKSYSGQLKSLENSLVQQLLKMLTG